MSGIGVPMSQIGALQCGRGAPSARVEILGL